MGSISNRQTALYDVTVLTVDGSDVVGLFRNATFEVTTEEIDVSALLDEWKQREEGPKDWRMTCTNLVETSAKYLDSIVSGGACVVSFEMTGLKFLGTGMMTGVPLSIDNPITEEVTIVSAGGAPTITIG